MVELLYPVTPPRLAGEQTVSSEILPVVEPSGLVTGRTTRYECHYGGKKPLHPVVHLHIIDHLGRMYLQKRSALKRSWPHCWDFAVGGHIGYGEYSSEALFREAGEEIGFYDFNPLPLGDYVYECDRERELVLVFAAVGSYDLHPDNLEVEDGRWWEPDEIADNLGKSIFTPNFEKEYDLFKDKLFSLL